MGLVFNRSEYIGMSLPEYIDSQANPDCEICLGWGLVCEEHEDKPWESGLSTDCLCGSPCGMPCKCTGIRSID